MGAHPSTGEIISAPAHGTLRRVVMWFRVVAFAWLAGLSTATLLTDPGADGTWVIATMVVAGLATVVTIWLALRGNLGSTWWLVTDGAVAAFTIIAPSLAKASDLFYGGLPLSWMLLVAWARPTLLAQSVAVGVMVASQLVGGATGIRTLTATDFVGDIAVWVVSGIVYGWGLYTVRETDVRRRRVEAALQRAEVSAEIARELHDSVLQLLAAIRMQPDRYQVSEVAQRLDRSIRRELNRMRAEFEDGLRVALYDAVAAVSEQFGVDLDSPLVDGDCPPNEETRAAVVAAREALTNAVRHAGTDRITVNARVEHAQLVIEVRDFGRGFDPNLAKQTIRDRVAAVGGRASVESSPGMGTQWTIRVPCPRTTPA